MKRIAAASVVVLALLVAAYLFVSLRGPDDDDAADDDAGPAAPAADDARPQADAPRKPARAPGRTLIGEVATDDGAPIAFATVKLTGAGLTTVVDADANGAFRVDGAPRIVDEILYEAAGYAPKVVLQPQLPDEAEVFVGETLVPTGVVRGAMTVDGAPLVGAHVHLRAADGHERAFIVAKTDKHGRFAVEKPPFSVSAVIAADHRHGSITQATKDTIEHRIDFPPSGSLAVRALGDDGEPVKRVTVAFDLRIPPVERDVVIALARGPGGPAKSVEKGDFQRDNLPPMPLRATFVSAGYKATERDVDILPGGTTSLTVDLEPSASAVGRVYDARPGKGIGGAVVRVMRGGRVLPEARTKKDGSFTFATLPDGRTTLKISADGYKTVEIAGVDGSGSNELSIEAPMTRGRAGDPEQYVGIGAVIGPSDEGVVVLDAQKGSPAASALVKGDLLVEVDGERLRGMPVDEAMLLIRGAPGTTARLLVKKGGQDPVVQVLLERKSLDRPKGTR